MIKAGILPNVVIHAIQTSHTDFDISPNGLTELKKQGVPDSVLDAMLTARGNAGQTPAQQSPAMAPQTSSPYKSVAGNALEGVKVIDLPESQRKLWAGTRYAGLGVLVVEVPQDSPAAIAWLQPGDVIVGIVKPHLGPTSVHDTAGFYTLATGCAPACLVEILYRSDYGPNAIGSSGMHYTCLLAGPAESNFAVVVDDKGSILYISKGLPPSRHSDAFFGGKPFRGKQDSDEFKNQGVREGLVKPVRSEEDCVRGGLSGTELDKCRAQFGKPENQAGKQSQEQAVQQEIAKIRNAPHEAMPPAQAARASLGGQTSMTVENGTSYLLHLYLSGPASQKVEIVGGGSQTLHLPPGHYEVAARVSNNAVTPFYGPEDYAPNTQYSSHFYIATRPR